MTAWNSYSPKASAKRALVRNPLDLLMRLQVRRKDEMSGYEQAGDACCDQERKFLHGGLNVSEPVLPGFRETPEGGSMK
jgi:hypothetical protein